LREECDSVTQLDEGSEINGYTMRGYAEYLIEEHALDIENMSIYEMAELFFEDDEVLLTEEQVDEVRQFIRRARITVTFA
jgi:hypothetical protein